MQVFLAGRVAVETDVGVIEDGGFPGRQGRLLFAYLVTEHGRPVPREELSEALWGESPPATRDKALAVLVSKLRGLLAAQGIDDANVLTAAFGCYRLELPAGTWIDTAVAERAARDADEALTARDLERAKAQAALAESLLAPPFLPGEDGEWARRERQHLAEVRGRAIEILCDAHLCSGDGEAAAVWAKQAVALEPFREGGYRRLMEAHALAGNRAEALRVYERCRRLLAEELGAYPSPETESVYRELLDGPVRPRAERSAPTRVAAPEHGPRRARSRRWVAAAATAVAVSGVVGGILSTRDVGSNAAPVAASSVVLIDARGNTASSPIRIGSAPSAVAAGDDSIWTVDAAAGAVHRVDRRTSAVETILVGTSPSGIAVCLGGAWVANHDDDTVSWISTQTNTVVKTIHVGAGPTAIACGYRSVWVTNANDRTLTRIDARTGDITRKAIPTNATGSGIAIGGGSVWVTDEANGSVYAVDPATNTVSDTATVGAGPTAISYGDGALWVANSLDDTVSRVDATTLRETAKVPVAGGPASVAFAHDVVWVGAEFGSRVVRIDPRRALPIGSTRVGDQPESLAAAAGGVWVAVRAAGAGHRGGRLVAGDGAPKSIDPASPDGWVAGLTRAEPVYETLTTFRHVGGASGTQVIPDLAAARPQPTAGGTTYTFHLRPGIRYSDGRPLRAVDFRRALTRLRALNDDNVLPESFLHLEVIVRGPSTLTFRLAHPEPRFLLDLIGLVPVPPGTPLHDVGRRPVPSTGPYEIESFVPGKLLTLVRNPYFHVSSPAAQPDGYPDEIVLRGTDRGSDSQDAAVRDVLSGRADLATEWAETPRFRVFALRRPRQVHSVAEQSTEFLFLNVKRAPFDDVRVRRALSFAVDRRRVAALHGAAFAQPACQAVPPTVPGFRPYCPYTVAPDASGEWRAPDLARARALVDASGTRGQRIVVWSVPYFAKEARYIVALLRTLGYRARLHSVATFSTYAETLRRRSSAQAGFVFYAANQGLAVDILQVVGCDLAYNWTRFCDPRIDAQLARLAKEEPADPARTRARAAALDRAITDRALLVPLLTLRFVSVTSPRVGNVQVNAGSILLDQLWVR